MTDFMLGQVIAGILVIALVHLIVGMALGRWFRFGALLPAFVVVLVESLIGDFRLGFAPWYLLFIAGIVILQIGYAGAARFRPVRRAAHRPTDSPGSMGAHARD